MTPFLQDFAKWIRKRTAAGTGHVSKTGFGFQEEDNEECREAFLAVEQMHLDVKEKGDNIEATLDALYSDIFDKMGDNKVVDNNLFINWLFNYKKGAESPEKSDSRAQLKDEVVRWFYSGYEESEPIENNQ